MRLLIPLGLISVTIFVTMIMWISGNGFYITYIPAASGDGISQYSPLWILAVELVAAYALFARQLWGGGDDYFCPCAGYVHRYLPGLDDFRPSGYVFDL